MGAFEQIQTEQGLQTIIHTSDANGKKTDIIFLGESGEQHVVTGEKPAVSVEVYQAMISLIRNRKPAEELD